jgi:hypothetical protein
MAKSDGEYPSQLATEHVRVFKADDETLLQMRIKGEYGSKAEVVQALISYLRCLITDGAVEDKCLEDALKEADKVNKK